MSFVEWVVVVIIFEKFVKVVVVVIVNWLVE